MGEPSRKAALTHITAKTALLLLFIGCYIAAYPLADSLRIVGESVTTLWLANAVLLAGLLQSRYRVWPVLVLAALLAHCLITGLYHWPLDVVVLGITVGCLDAVVGAALICRLLGASIDLSYRRHVWTLILVTAVVSGGCSSLACVMAQWTALRADVGTVWIPRWISDFLGILVVVPVILSWGKFFKTGWRKVCWSALFEGAVLVVVVVPLAYVVSTGRAGDPFWLLGLPYVLMLFLLWAAVRFPLWFSSALLFTITLQFASQAAVGHGPFVVPEQTATELALALQSFLAVNGLMVLFVSSLAHERRRAVVALSVSEETYRRTVEYQTEFIVRWLPDGTRTFVNDAYCRYFQVSRSELIGQSFLPLVTPEDRESILRKIGSLSPDHPAATDEHGVLVPDGSKAWHQWTDRAIFDRNGRVTELLSVGRDITERKLAEEALRERESELQSLLRAAPVGIGLVQKGVLYRANDRICMMLGYTRDELVGQKERVVYPTQKDYEFVRREEYGQIRDQGIGAAETRWQRKDGSIIDVWLSSVPIDENDPSAPVIFTALDITQRKAAEEALRKTENQLAHVTRLSTLGEMIAGIAHELNQPLYSIVNFAKACQNVLAADREPDLESARQWTNDIATAAARAGQIVRQLRGFAQPTETTRSETDINHIIEESIGLLSTEIRRDEVTVRFDPEFAPVLVRVDGIQIQQVLVNLVRNACEAMSEHGNSQHLMRIRSMIRDETVEVAVADTGPGLPADNELKIFDAFVSTKKTGLGMGLAVSTTIVEAHGGKLWASTNSDQGATFHFTLPMIAGNGDSRSERS